MDRPDPTLESVRDCTHVRWLPSALLDLPPEEPVFATRTPHRVSLQALPASRSALAALLANGAFDLVLEIDDDRAPLRHAPILDVHEARLAPDLPIDWGLYYWIVDGLLEDLQTQAGDPAAALAMGRARLEALDDALRTARRRRRTLDMRALEAIWLTCTSPVAPDPEKHGEPGQALQQYVRGLASHLAEHAHTRSFSEWTRALLQHVERQSGLGLPALRAAEQNRLSLYAQHRLFGSPWLTAPAGIIAGWHLLISAHVLAVWSAGVAVHAGHETRLDEALLTSLWMLDQGLWRDEPLVHDVLRNLNASEYTSPALASALVTALRGAPAQA